jgi:hypothetical protein
LSGSAADWANNGMCSEDNDDSGYCTRDFGASVYITEIVYSGDCTPWTGCRFSLQVSTDGSTWTTLHGPVGNGTYTVTVNGNYRYVREVKSDVNWWGMSLTYVCGHS